MSALLVGCQPLPEPAEAGADTEVAEPDWSGTFLPSSGDTDDGNADDSTGGALPDPTVCVENRTRAYFEIDSSQDLAGVEIVQGPLILRNMSDEDMQWAQCLRRVTDLQHLSGDLSIGSNAALTNLDALQHLESVSGSLQIGDNPALQDVDGLASLTELEWLAVQQNEVLTSVAGLEQVVTQRLDLRGNPMLTSATFSAVSELGQLGVSDNTQLTVLSFPSLTKAGTVEIHRLPLLADLSGFAALQQVGRLNLQGLDALSSLTGLASLREVSQGLLTLMLPELEELALPSLTHAQALTVHEMASLQRIDLPAIGQLHELRLHALPQLAELPNVPAAAGLRSIELDELALVSTLDPVQGGSSVMSKLVLSNMPLLAEFDALAGVTSVEEELQLAGLPLLDSLAPLADMSWVGSASFESLPGLTSLAGLEQLQTAWSIELTQLNGLSSLAELSGLTEVETLTVRGNAQLDSLQGLEQLGVVRALGVVENPMLTSIDALSGGALALHAEWIELKDNLALSQCVAEAFLQSLLDAGWLGDSDVANNGPC